MHFFIKNNMIFLSFLFFKIIDILNDISCAKMPFLAVSLKFGFLILIIEINQKVNWKSFKFSCLTLFIKK